MRGPSQQRRVPGDVPVHTEERPDGIEALMRESSGSWMVLVEPRDHTPEDLEGVDIG